MYLEADRGVKKSAGITARLGEGLGAMLRLFPAGAPMWIYTRVLHRWPLRALTHFLLMRLIPERIIMPEGTLLLNKKDAVVSGALTLGVYERGSLARWRELVKDGMTVVDVGANIGIYTLIAARRNPNGRVIAIEPNAENADVLERMIKVNSLRNVTVLRVAAGATRGQGMLHLDQHNKGQHSLVAFQEAVGSETVSVHRIDDVMSEMGVHRVDLVKMDIEGFEAKAFAGMSGLLDTGHPTLLFEFMPEWIRRAGDDPCELLMSLEKRGYHLSTLNEDDGSAEPLTDIVRFLTRFQKPNDYVNMLALHRESSYNA